MDKIFFDANFIVGIFHEIDSLHSRSKLLGRQLKKRHYQRVVSNYVINEVLTVLRRRATDGLVEVVTNLLFSPSLEVINESAAHDEYAKDLFLKHAKDRLSFTDASIIATMKYEHVSHLVTFDKNLASVAKKYGITVLS